MPGIVVWILTIGNPDARWNDSKILEVKVISEAVIQEK
jgi:hypothetical protein